MRPAARQKVERKKVVRTTGSPRFPTVRRSNVEQAAEAQNAAEDEVTDRQAVRGRIENENAAPETDRENGGKR